jgi:hypothetical protein
MVTLRRESSIVLRTNAVTYDIVHETRCDEKHDRGKKHGQPAA